MLVRKYIVNNKIFKLHKYCNAIIFYPSDRPPVGTHSTFPAILLLWEFFFAIHILLGLFFANAPCTFLPQSISGVAEKLYLAKMDKTVIKVV